MTSPEFPNLTVVDHPLVQHKISMLRTPEVNPSTFRTLVNEIAVALAYEATRTLEVEDIDVETPLERMTGKRLTGRAPALAPILRAGLGMVNGVLSVIPTAKVGHIGMYRDHESLEPVDYYFKIPDHAADRLFLVLDPMLATGGSAVSAVSSLRKHGARRMCFLCLVAAPEGVARMAQHHPTVPVFAAALDRELNELGYILPGLGDAGDRLFGTI